MIETCKPDAVLAKLVPPVRPNPRIIYVPSQFSLPFEHQGKGYCFNTLTKQCVEGRLPEAAKAGEGYDEWITGQFLVPADKDECAYYNQISALMRAYSKKKEVRGYTILPTLDCNARCVYCYEEGTKPVSMSSETVEQTIRFIRNNCGGSEVKLSWFGGEPLLRPDIIDRICAGVGEAWNISPP